MALSAPATQDGTERTDICPGTCNSAWRRETRLYRARLAEYDAKLASVPEGEKPPERPVPPDLRPWRRDPVWCTRCATLIRAELAELDTLAAQVAMLPPGIRPAAPGPREHVRVTGSQAEPSPSPAGDDLDELDRWLRSWQGILLDDDDVLPRYADQAAAIRKVSAWLYHNYPALIRHPEHGEDFGIGVRRWHRLLEASVHEASYARHLHKECPKCHRYSLWERPGEEYVACVYDACNARLTRSELGQGAA